MAQCNKQHYVYGEHKSLMQIPCYYIAGICIVDPIHQGPMEMFLRTTYPFYHSPLYENSKTRKQNMVPNDIKFANISFDRTDRRNVKRRY